jgi:hypothetical protein
MKKSFLVIFTIIFFIACSNKNKVPKGILPKDKMEAIIWDMTRTGEFLTNYVFKDSTINKTAKSLEWFDKVYSFHHVTKDEFEKSYEYYKKHPALLKQIVDSLEKRNPGNNPEPFWSKEQKSSSIPDSTKKNSSLSQKKIDKALIMDSLKNKAGKIQRPQ